jgi:hypothetical protein
MKPVVEYRGEPMFNLHSLSPKLETATVYGINHPLLGTQLIHTSKVLHKSPNGDFETRNTLYRKTI